MIADPRYDPEGARDERDATLARCLHAFRRGVIGEAAFRVSCRALALRDDDIDALVREAQPGR